eukprot:gene22273-23378_t
MLSPSAGRRQSHPPPAARGAIFARRYKLIRGSEMLSTLARQADD